MKDNHVDFRLADRRPVKIEILPFQPIVWGTITPPDVRSPNGYTARFPLVVDTGLNMDSVTISPTQLLTWAGIRLESLTKIGKSTQFRNGAKFTPFGAFLWISHNQTGYRDKFTGESTLLQLDCLSVFDDDGDSPPMPCIGLGALALSNIDLFVSSKPKRIGTSDADGGTIGTERHFHLTQTDGPQPRRRRRSAR
jgi:hypothetical protein